MRVIDGTVDIIDGPIVDIISLVPILRGIGDASREQRQ
jgi:hypothetical protein